MPVPTGGGEASQLVDQARNDVAARAGVPPEAVGIVRVEAVEWPDTSLGCPQPGMLYAQVMTPGYLIILEAAGKRYEFHTDRQRLVLCRESAALSRDKQDSIWPSVRLLLRQPSPFGQ